LEEIGLEGQRLQMINISAAMAGEFAFSAAEITAEIREIGPNPLRRDADLPKGIMAIQKPGRMPGVEHVGED
jgi:hypothetical protein